MSDENMQPFNGPQINKIDGIGVGNAIPSDSPKIIKVVGIGGGGGNAVNHMYRQGIHDVTFLLCNTDNQALRESPIPVKLQLGKEGLGAGNNPAKAREAAEESSDDIKTLFNDGTKMVFITAGMGGGTGTGAAPVIAQIAKEMGILTIGIVTIPFRWEGDQKILQALDGVEAISKHVDAMVVVNNERLNEVYNEQSFAGARARADETLSVAVKSIAEIITLRGEINLDFNDVKTVLKDGGVAIMSTGYGEGDTRVSQAIKNAQYSPLLNSNNIFNSKKVLFNISYSEECELMMNEMDEVRSFMEQFNSGYRLKWGIAVDNTLGKKVKMTLLATGFNISDLHVDVPGRSKKEQQKIDEEREQREKENQMRIDEYYDKGGVTRKQRFIYLLTPEDFDNMELISMIEETPTARRDRSDYNRIKTKSQAVVQEAEPATDPSAENKGVISF